MKYFVFCSGYSGPFVAATVGLLFLQRLQWAYSFFRNLQKKFPSCSDRGTLQICYPLLSTVRFCILLSDPPLPPSRGLHLSVIRGRVDHLCALGTSLEPSLDVRVGILFTYQKHLYGRIIFTERYRLGPQNQFNHTELSCIYVLGVSLRSHLFIEESGVPGENHQQILLHNVVSGTPRHDRHSNSERQCIGSSKSNYHTITTMTNMKKCINKIKMSNP